MLVISLYEMNDAEYTNIEKKRTKEKRTKTISVDNEFSADEKMKKIDIESDHLTLANFHITDRPSHTHTY